MLQGKVAVITGASTGMGRAAALLFAQNGAKVVVNYASNAADADKTVAEIAHNGGEAFACRANVADAAECERLMQAAVDRWGRLDILVNNAGYTDFIPLADLDAVTPEVWTKVLGTDVMGPFFCARAAARQMRKTGGGSIINNASVSGHRPNGSCIPYLSAKAALLHLTRTLAKVLGPDIRVNSVSPGFIEDTNWTNKRVGVDRPAEVRVAADMALLKRTGTAHDVAQAMLFLASDQSSYCTGIDLLVDGGRQFSI